MPARTSRTTSTRSAEGPDAGVGLLSSVVGVTVFLVLLLFAVQLVLNLYATSAVTAVAFAAARQVAGADGGSDAIAAAEAKGRDTLARFEEGGGELAFAWDTSGDDTVVVQVTARRPSLLPRVRFPFDEITRTV